MELDCDLRGDTCPSRSTGEATHPSTSLYDAAVSSSQPYRLVLVCEKSPPLLVPFGARLLEQLYFLFFPLRAIITDSLKEEVPALVLLQSSGIAEPPAMT